MDKVDELSWEIPAWLASLMSIPGIFLAIWGYRVWSEGASSYWAGFGSTAIIGAIMMLGILFHLFRIIRRRQRYLAAMRAEQATAQGLDSLKALGCFVFHDIQAPGFNIDHVVVGPGGVFAIETKSRRKPVRGKGGDDARVIYDGQRLSFPDWTETKPLKQARAQAKWLAESLSKSTGHKVPVKPVLALPGWYVDCKGRGDVSVISPVRCDWMARPVSGEALDAALIQRIRYQLDGLSAMKLPEDRGQGRAVMSRS